LIVLNSKRPLTEIYSALAAKTFTRIQLKPSDTKRILFEVPLSQELVTVDGFLSYWPKQLSFLLTQKCFFYFFFSATIFFKSTFSTENWSIGV